jgi:hypothetical protein
LTETDSETETESESDAETETETETESDSETVTDSETGSAYFFSRRFCASRSAVLICGARGAGRAPLDRVGDVPIGR